MFNFPRLSQEADIELPSGEKKMKEARGTLAYWVITFCVAGFLTISASYVSTLIGDKNEAKKETVTAQDKNNSLQDTIKAMLEERITELMPVKQQVQQMKQSVDSLKLK